MAPLSQGYEAFCIVSYEEDPQAQLAPAESAASPSKTQPETTDSAPPPVSPTTTARLTELVFHLNGAGISSMYLGPQLSKRPTIAIQIPMAKRGDVVSVLWRNAQNQQGTVETRIT